MCIRQKIPRAFYSRGSSSIKKKILLLSSVSARLYSIYIHTLFTDRENRYIQYRALTREHEYIKFGYKLAFERKKR